MLEALSYILICIGLFPLCFALIPMLEYPKASYDKKGKKQLLQMFCGLFFSGVILIGSGYLLLQYDRNTDYEEMQSRSVIVDNVYVSKITNGNNNLSFADLAKNDHYETFRLWYEYDKNVGGIKKGDRIDMRFDPKTKTVLNIINVYRERPDDNPFISESY